jgi:hypothetical protein
LGQIQFITLTNILDDTGSTYLELFDGDCLRLGLTPGYHSWRNNVLLDTANGQGIRKSFKVEVQLLVNGAHLDQSRTSERQLLLAWGKANYTVQGCFSETPSSLRPARMGVEDYISRTGKRALFDPSLPSSSSVISTA